MRLLGARHVAALEVALGEARQRGDVLRVLLQDGGIDFGRALQVARLQRLVGGLDGGGRVGRRLLAQQAIDERLDRALGLRAHEAVERPAVAEGIDRRERLHAQLAGDGLVLVDVDLDERAPCRSCARTTFSRMGVSCLQGPHQGAQKSTSTGTWREASITSLAKVAVVAFLIDLAARRLRRVARLAKSKNHVRLQALPIMGVSVLPRRELQPPHGVRLRQPPPRYAARGRRSG